MNTLVPGVLSNILHNMNTNTIPTSDRGPFLLQVIGIVPTLVGSELFPDHGFYLKVSDSAYATYVALPKENGDLILCDQIKLGQFIHVDCLEPATPVPILRGVRPVPGCHLCLGEPEDIIAAYPCSLPRTAKVEKTGTHILLKSTSSRSIPSSPTSSHSPPLALGKKAIEGKKEAAMKSGLVQRVAGRRSLDGNSVSGTESGIRAPRRSWDSDLDSKAKEKISSSLSKRQMSISITKRTQDKKEMFWSKEAKEVYPRKALSSALADDSAKSNNKKCLAAKKKSEARKDLIINNIIKITPSGTEKTDSSIPWGSLPSSIEKLSKEILRHRDASELAAIEALQETYISECLIQCASMYTKLCSSASAHDPQSTVDQFLHLHAAVLSNSSESPEIRMRSASWIAAALASGLSPFTIHAHHGLTASRSTLPSHTGSGVSILRGAELAQVLETEVRQWFLGFVDRVLDGDVVEKRLWDRNQAAERMARLKKVNDWLKRVEEMDMPEGMIGKLRRKIYKVLIRHVDSATAVALGGP